MQGRSLSRRSHPQSVTLLSLLLLLLVGVECAHGYTEELLLQGMPDGATLAHFDFNAAVPLHARHTQSVPAALLDVAQRHGVQQLELALTQGRWNWEWQQAAAAAGAASAPKPSGLLLTVAFGPAVGDSRAAYGDLTQALGGLLCAGVATVPHLAVMAVPAVGWFSHQLPAAAAAAPLSTAAAAAAGASQCSSDRRQVYAWLPQEALCSENLAAWRRLLPCRQHAGLAALLDPLQLAEAPYYSLGLQLQVLPAGPHAAAPNSSSGPGSQQQPWAELRQALTAVLPARTAPGPGQPQQDQDLVHAAFGSGLPPTCPAASHSMLYVAPCHGAAVASGGERIGTALSSSNSSCTWEQTPAGPLLACGTTPPGLHVPASILRPGSSSSSNNSNTAGQQQQRQQQQRQQQQPSHVPQVVQHVRQRGATAGTLMLGVRVAAAAGVQSCGGASCDLRLHIMQLLPWQLLVGSCSLRVSFGRQAQQAQRSPEVLWQSVDARPDRSSLVELLIRLPAAVVASSGNASSGTASWHEVEVSVDFRIPFLGVFDHAADASRGVDVPPAVATLLPAACANSSSWAGMHGGSASSGGAGTAGAAEGRTAGPLLQRLRGDCGARQAYSGGGGSSVVALPIPDFSMPFNVACFTSTLLAILFGGLVNLVVRRPEELLGDKAGATAAGGTPVWKRKLRRVVALLLLTGVLAVYLDRDLQRQLDAAWATLRHLLLGRTQAPEQRGEL